MEIVIISGPRASGKTHLAAMLAVANAPEERLSGNLKLLAGKVYMGCARVGYSALIEVRSPADVRIPADEKDVSTLYVVCNGCVVYPSD